MKKLILTIMSLLIGLIAYSQVYITYQDSVVTNSVVVVTGTDLYTDLSMPVENQTVKIYNNTPNAINMTVQKIIVDTVAGSSNLFCWDLCYPPNVYSSGMVNIPPGTSFDNFSAHYSPNGHYGVTKIRYLFYPALIYLEVWFDVSSNSISDISNTNIKYYPNPVVDYLYFSKDIKDITIYNSIGEEVYKGKNQNSLYLGNYVKGIYFININNQSKIKVIKS